MSEAIEFTTDFEGNISSITVTSDISDGYTPTIEIDTSEADNLPTIEVNSDDVEILIDSTNLPENEDKTVFINTIDDAPPRVISYILGGIRTIVGEKAWIFNNTEEMRQWLNIQSNVNKLTAGDDIRIKEPGASDYWWDGAALHITAASGLTIEEVARVYKDSVDNVFGDIIYVND